MLLACFIQTLSLFRQLKNVASRVFKGHFTSETGPRWNIFPGFRKCRNAWIFLYIALLQIPPANTACSLGWGERGFTLRILTCLSPKTSARDKGSVHYISSWPQVSHTKWFSQALLIHLSTNLQRAPGILFSFNPRSRALAQHFRALCQKLGFTAPWEDGEADGQHADTEADSRLDKRLSGITRIPRAKPPLSLRGF